MLHRGDDAAGEVAAVGVVPDLLAVAEDVQRVLALHDLLHEVGDHVAHRQLHVAAQHLDLAPGAHLADAHAVERPHDRVRQAVLVVRGARRSTRPRASGSRTTSRGGGISSSWPSYDGHDVGRLEHHRRADERDLPEAAAAVRGDGGVAGGRDDPLVRREQVVRVGVEVRDAADHRRAGDEVVDVAGEVGEQVDVARVGLHQAVAGVVAVRLHHRPVLRVVVDADHAVPAARAAPPPRSRR